MTIRYADTSERPDGVFRLQRKVELTRRPLGGTARMIHPLRGYLGEDQ